MRLRHHLSRVQQKIASVRPVQSSRLDQVKDRRCGFKMSS
jgi:hypothetical protein